MGKAAALKKRTTVKNSDPAADMLGAFDARTRMVQSVASMGWRMAVMIIVPVFIGLKLDQHFDTKPSYVLSGFFLAVAGCGYLIYKEYKQINTEMSLMDAPKVRTNRRKKESK